MSDSKKAYKNWKLKKGSDIIFPNQIWEAACAWQASAQDGGEPVAWLWLKHGAKTPVPKDFADELIADGECVHSLYTHPPSAVVQESAACVSPAPHYETQRGLSCKNDTQSTVVPSGVWQFYQDGEWHTGMNNIRHRADTEAAGYKVRDLWVKQEQES
jgi:hypothetical protein